MIQGVDDGLRRRLDRLETRGRNMLSTKERRQAFRQALTWAAAASAIGPLALLLSAPFVAPTLTTAVIALAGVPIASAAFGYVRARRVPARPRAAALALLDHRLRLNDRLQTSDEFERLDRRTAFHDAALQEAAPWVARAQASAVDDEAAPLKLGRSRLWLWPVAGLVCLVAAFVAPQFAAGAGAGESNPATFGVTSRPSVAELPASSIRPPSIPGAAPSSTQEGDVKAAVRPGQDTPGARLVAAFQRLMARLSSSGGAAIAAQSATVRPSAPSQAAAGGEGAGRGAQGAAGTSASQSAAAQDHEGEQPRDEAQQTPGEPGEKDDADAPASQASSGQFAGARQAAPPASRPQPPQEGSGPSQNGEGQQPGRSRRGDQGQSGREQGGGQGENGNPSGADTGPKKGRGVSSLMLATPMQDRLSGMISPGRIRTTTRDGAPQPLPAGSASAQDRGTAQGEAGRTASRPASAQEQRVTRDYFNARNGGGR
ncbi:hypothetical protein GCM10017620_13050 [Brevundimonas intermedia]|uniref:DUF4175 family protein n=2 Tax=Brevundimonas intermedia TaxID=74315 RepID=A0ABQ5T6W4_9CAUL|nr:hypothetical protein GCM10017620_13050 [Brevundimonas intermedia]